ncbi:hypothetical protein [Streptomyces scabiei]|uniref:hypothetical protein n=1 Tax=Streptomyces TaxID=1883 RepID=UPI00299FF8FA|nr:hypothetical protein [Streptomyces scabiei]MDX3116014.1 hypothetical protein [Streptomyces scabiei]
MNAFHTHSDMSHRSRYQDMTEMRLQLSAESVREHVPADALDAFARRLPRPRKNAVGGYSSGELERLTAATRAATACIARRVRANEDLIRRFESTPEQLSTEERSTAEELVAMASTGVVPGRADPGDVAERVQRASRLFLTWRDLAPLLVLLAIVTERNGETIKELPTRHRVLEGRAVELVVVKRRRGTKRWFETVTWEIGPKGRELHTPGGLYFLLLELTVRSRGFCGSTAAICFWRNGHRAGVQGPAEHWAPFEHDLRLGAFIELSGWAAGRRQPLYADPRPPTKKKEKDTSRTEDSADSDDPPLLEVSFNRIKASVDARRTKKLGGHLPSSAKSNTAQVLFTNYLKPDEATREWAEEVIGKAVADAEQAAHDAHAAVVARR